MQTPLNHVVQAYIDNLVTTGQEVGLQVAAYVDGQLVVDAWAGVADESSGRPVDGDTLFTSWSTTKGFVATCIHILADRGKLEYGAPVARYWPEFAAQGKERVTVLDLLTHRAGVPQMPEDVTAEMMTDWDAMCRAIANHPPLWEPGTKTGYHAWTFGWLLGEVVRRVDGRPIEQFVQEEVCQPLGIDSFFMGIPDRVAGRVATLRQDAAHVDDVAQWNALKLRAMPPHVTTAEVVNRPDVLRAVIPGGGGTMNARAIARHYAMLAGFGELDGVRILSPERVEMMRTLQTDDLDIVADSRIRKGMGYFLGGAEADGGAIAIGPSGKEFGHSGNGGSLGFADPERNFSFGLTKNLMRAMPDAAQSTPYLLAELIRKQLPRSS
jgi:CubicO group peptidase (beta-lactamase class C family)